MTNKDIVSMLNAGVLEATSHTISAAHAYKLIKYKGAVRKAVTAIQEREKEAMSEAGIADGAAFDERLAELRGKEGRTPEEETELAEMTGKLARFIELRNAIQDDAVTLEGVKAMPWEEYHSLASENAHTQVAGRTVDTFTVLEEMLEGVLWTAPEE